MRTLRESNWILMSFCSNWTNPVSALFQFKELPLQQPLSLRNSPHSHPLISAWGTPPQPLSCLSLGIHLVDVLHLVQRTHFVHSMLPAQWCLWKTQPVLLTPVLAVEEHTSPGVTLQAPGRLTQGFAIISHTRNLPGANTASLRLSVKAIHGRMV